MVRSTWDTALETFHMANSPKSGKASGRSKQEASDKEDRHPSGDSRKSDVKGSSERTVDSESPTTLFSLIKAKRWSEVIARAKEERDEAATWIVEKNVDGTDRWRLLPIHQACELQPPENVVTSLIEAFPASVMMKDSGGDLPLHLACRDRASETVIAILVQADGRSAKIANSEGRLPLHLACRQGVDVSVIDGLLVSYHRGARTLDSYGLLPLHWASAQNASTAVVESLLRANPDGVDVKDKWGRTPLSLVQASINPEKEMIIEALNRDASFWTTTLIREVSTLKVKLEDKTVQEKEMKKKAVSLEEKLVEVTAASSAAAQSFRELKDELQSENRTLRSKVSGLQATLDVTEKKIAEITDENEMLHKKGESMANDIKVLSDLLRTMEEHRLQILKLTGHWEDQLQRASELVHEGDGKSSA